jgi:hypothetical protein
VPFPAVQVFESHALVYQAGVTLARKRGGELGDIEEAVGVVFDDECVFEVLNGKRVLRLGLKSLTGRADVDRRSREKPESWLWLIACGELVLSLAVSRASGGGKARGEESREVRA